MNQAQRLFILATLETLETTINAQIKALRAIVALAQNESGVKVVNAVEEHSIEELEDAFERNIFSLGAEQ